MVAPDSAAADMVSGLMTDEGGLRKMRALGNLGVAAWAA
jgi:hypothetical protein